MSIHVEAVSSNAIEHNDRLYGAARDAIRLLDTCREVIPSHVKDQLNAEVLPEALLVYDTLLGDILIGKSGNTATISIVAPKPIASDVLRIIEPTFEGDTLLPITLAIGLDGKSVNTTARINTTFLPVTHQETVLVAVGRIVEMLGWVNTPDAQGFHRATGIDVSAFSEFFSFCVGYQPKSIEQEQGNNADEETEQNHTGLVYTYYHNRPRQAPQIIDQTMQERGISSDPPALPVKIELRTATSPFPLSLGEILQSPHDIPLLFTLESHWGRQYQLKGLGLKAGRFDGLIGKRLVVEDRNVRDEFSKQIFQKTAKVPNFARTLLIYDYIGLMPRFQGTNRFIASSSSSEPTKQAEELIALLPTQYRKGDAYRKELYARQQYASRSNFYQMLMAVQELVRKAGWGVAMIQTDHLEETVIGKPDYQYAYHVAWQRKNGLWGSNKNPVGRGDFRGFLYYPPEQIQNNGLRWSLRSWHR